VGFATLHPPTSDSNRTGRKFVNELIEKCKLLLALYEGCQNMFKSKTSPRKDEIEKV